MLRIDFRTLSSAGVLLAYVVGSLALSPSAFAQPSITHSAPAAIYPSGTTRLVLHGDNLAAPLRVWSSADVKVAVVDVQTKSATLDVTTQTELPLGEIGLWVATADGISAPIGLLVDDLPSSTENSDNHAPATAQTIGMSSAVDAMSNGKQADYFRFHADAGQEITLEVLVQPFGSPLDPVVRLLTESSEVLTLVDDEAIRPDCRFRHCFENSGNYLLQVHDNRYTAGGRYRLRIGNFPVVAFAYPPVVQRGTCAELRFAGEDSARMTTRSVLVPEDPLLDELPLTAYFASGGSPSWASVRLSNDQQMLETEPNDTQAEANAIDAARGLNGLLEKPGDRDFYQLKGTKDQTVRCAASARSFGSVTLLKMTLRSATGEVVGKTTVGDSDEWQFDARFPADGLYFLEVEDLLHRGGSEHGYHVSIAPVPGFTLALKADAKTLDRFPIQCARGAAALDIVVQREGFEDAIELQFEPPVEGLKIFNPTIPAKAKAARVYVLSQAGWTAEQFYGLSVVGRPVVADGTEPGSRVALSTKGLLTTRAPHKPYPAAWQDGLVAVAGVADQPAYFEIQAAENPVALPRSLAESQFTLNMKRVQAEFKADATLFHNEAPAEWSVSTKADKDKIQVTVKRPLASPVDSAELKFLWYGEHAGRGQVVETTIPVKLFDPVKITVVDLMPIKAGQSQRVAVEIARDPAAGEPQPVVLKLQNLPAGVTAPESVTIPAQESKAEFELTAAADGAPTKVANIILTAQTKSGTLDVTSQSEPLALEVLAP